MRFVIKQREYNKVYKWDEIGYLFLNSGSGIYKHTYAIKDFEKWCVDYDNYITVQKCYNVIVYYYEHLKDNLITEFETTQPLYNIGEEIEYNGEKYQIKEINRKFDDYVVFYIENKYNETEIGLEEAKMQYEEHKVNECDKWIVFDSEEDFKYYKNTGKLKEKKEDEELSNEKVRLIDKIKRKFNLK